MAMYCSTCGQSYPDSYNTCTCRLCGGLIESDPALRPLSPKVYDLDTMWYDWKHKMLAAPPHPLTEADWDKTCAHFNGCALCGAEDIDEKMLFIPTFCGGRLYSYNVIPMCSFCADRVRKSQLTNPLKTYFKLKNVSERRVIGIMNYLEAIMLGKVFEEFDFEHDTIKIVVKVVEDTSNKPFKGVFARRLWDKNAPLEVEHSIRMPSVASTDEVAGITWRLLED